MAGDPSLYDEIERAIASAAVGLPSEGDRDDLDTWPPDERELLVSLAHDKDVLNEHRKGSVGVRGGTEPQVCRSCGESRPCPPIRDLRDRYNAVGRADG
ncbi:hypothetical protein GCM10009623_08470 [Nocardioides aestuarii]